MADGGRTAHFQYTETLSCNISKSSGMAKVLRTCKLIVWDECTMAHKKTLEAFHRIMQDFRSNQQPFAGALILLSGDFRQTLSVILRSTTADELNACLKSPRLWVHVRKLSLTTNMRVQLLNDASAARFAKQLLNIGNGKMPIDATTKCITFPTDFCNLKETKEDLIQSVFSAIAQNYKNHQWVSVRAILAANNLDVNAINMSIQNKIPGGTAT